MYKAETGLLTQMNARRLFVASFLTRVVGGIVFALRSSIIGDWGRLYGFTQSELGSISDGGFTGFGLTIIFFSLLADRVGYGRLYPISRTRRAERSSSEGALVFGLWNLF